MAWFAKIGLAFSLAVSSFLGLFHHSQPPQTPVSTTASSTVGTSALPPTNNKVSVGIYFKDSNHVYNGGGGIIAGADPSTFELCDSDPSHNDCAKDASHVYLDDMILQDADPASFVEFNDNYGKDKNHVFFLKSGDEGPLPHVIEGADPQSFEAVGGGYGKDANNIYWFGVSISPPVDPQTFSLINSNNIYYLKDAQHVYVLDNYKAINIAGADPETFTLLSNVSGYTYAKDKSHVYYEADLIPDADPATFQVVAAQSTYDAEDKNHKYLNGQIVQDSSQSTAVWHTVLSQNLSGESLDPSEAFDLKGSQVRISYSCDQTRGDLSIYLAEVNPPDEWTSQDTCPTEQQKIYSVPAGQYELYFLVGGAVNSTVKVEDFY